ncbi:polymerase [Pyrenophora tritici-repentis]|nr:polymerase [Pyrenophora tritici-repentis]
MNDVLIDYLDNFCIAYLDDILIYSESELEHIRHVRKVLERLRQAGLQVDIKKTEFHVIGRNTWALRNWVRPTTVTGVKSFLGFTGFYRQFVPETRELTKPIIALQSPSKPFVWDSDCDRAFKS